MSNPSDIVMEMERNVEAASSYLKALCNETRLMILCHLLPGEKSVTELENLLGTRQATVSQHLARLKVDRLVSVRRQGKLSFYSITDESATSILMVLKNRFC